MVGPHKQEAHKLFEWFDASIALRVRLDELQQEICCVEVSMGWMDGRETCEQRVEIDFTRQRHSTTEWGRACP